MTGADTTGRLREQRDRFLAFAFAGAEMLLELERDLVIGWCAGATERLLGRGPDALVGTTLTDLVAADDQATLTEMVRRLETAGRLDRMLLRFQTADGDPRRCTVSGITLPDRPGVIHLTASRARGTDLRRRAETGGDGPPGDRTSFGAMVEERMRDAERFGEDVRLTLIDLTDAALQDSLEPDVADRFMHNVESYLRAWSVGGDSVGRLEGDKLGVVHDPSLDTGQIESRIADISARFDPAGEGIHVKAATMDLDRGGLSSEDVSKALVYTLNRFVDEGGEAFAVASLSMGYEKALDETLSKVNAFRQTINSENLILVYQPIVDLTGWRVHHYEALSRMRQGERLHLPGRLIGFAEEFGVVTELDLIVVRKAMAALRHPGALPEKAAIAVNLSGRSIASEAFVQQLFLLLLENRDILNRLMFEITESTEMRDLDAANRVLQKLRAFGCEISIDDFGAGAAAFPYLKALHVDYVKIDGSYIRDAFTSRHGRPFLSAIARLARDLGIRSIGEMVEDARTMWLLREVGVHHGQGFFFGKPLPDVSKFSLAPPPEAGSRGSIDGARIHRDK